MRGLLITPLAGAVLAAGCAAPGAGNSFDPGDLPATSGARAATGSPVPSAETVEVGEGLKLVVEWPAAVPAEHRKMFETYRDTQTRLYRAVLTRGEEEGYAARMDAEVAQESYRWVKDFLDQRRSLSGTVRLYHLRVPSVTGDGAQVDVCVDQTGLRLTDARTGKAVTTQPAWARPPESTYLQSALMHRQDDGTWRIRSYRHAVPPHERAKGCQR
ncbi:hypothetical protein [Microtetraspora sp. NBRC 13810]|uniref:hypothetical protein n=1 Tax=Microtetraspora sp. NBRC 13810 TaxID=3030990 RepID=UPI0025562956|nr:hypothetical protein [Microtetraspora sp. NBRC 13810]